MRKIDWKKRVLSLLLAVMMVLSAVPRGAVPARAVTPDSRVADDSTFDSWEQFFDMNNLSTANAGMVWTDKSVFTEVPAGLKGLHDLDDLNAALNTTTDITMDTEEMDNFLVALSVMASNKTITGYSTVPTDTVFILDLSSSMRSNDNDNGSAIDELVDETNQAIAKLLALNNHNRVGVVLYAGNVNGNWTTIDEGITQVLLPLDTYTTTSGAYLRSAVRQGSSGPHADQRVEVASGVRNSRGNTVTGGMDSNTGTFIQDGIYEAMQQFLSADPVIPEGKIQAGTVRMPFMVLMSDGEPTMGTYRFAGDSSTGTTNGVPTSLGDGVLRFNDTSYDNTQEDMRYAIAFVTQLTAAYAKNKVAEHYGTDPLFYTLTYGEEATRREEALSVMNPAATCQTMRTMWTTMQRDGQVNLVHSNKTGGGRNPSYTWYVATENAYVDEADDLYYVDKFFPANTDDEFSAAFQALVDEIILQSRYTPTLVESGDHDLDGYVSFVDHIGEHMDVTDVKGMVLGDRFYSGKAFSEYIVTGKGGSIENPSELGDEFIRSVKARLGISDTGTAQALIQQAYNHGQIAFDTETGAFSNYVGWYSDVNGNFLGFWYEGIDVAVPAGATHINKSYGYVGEVDDEHGVRASDMMYTTVRVREEIATGDETLAWAIPSALIPTVEYQVKLDGDTYDSDLDALTVIGATEGPIRLIFEVALDEELHNYNIQEVMGSVPGHDDHLGKYVFYSNNWSATQTSDINTYSYFEASKQNERYYYISDSVIFTDEAGSVAYTGETAPDTDGTYYHEYYVYSKANGTQRVMVKVSADALADAKKDGSNWIIPKGTEYQLLSTRHRAKGVNTTGTMDHVVYAVVEKSADAEYHTAAVLGNNGKLTVTPATGIKVTKTLAETVENGTTAFTFVISGGTGEATLVRPNQGTDGADVTEKLTFTNGEASFIVSADETVYIIGLEAGTTYTVTEEGNPHYAVQTITVGGNVANTATVTAVAGKVETVDFVNAPKGYGDLYITKEVTPADGHTVPAEMLNKEFELTVTMVGVADQEFDAEHSGDHTLTKVSVVDGKFTVTLKHADTFEVFGIPENTKVTVIENLDTNSNFQVTYRTRNYSGAEADADNAVTITKDANSAVVVMNQYTPKSTTVDLDIAGTKTFAPETPIAADFTFKVQRYTGSEWIDVDGKTATVRYSNNETGDKTFRIENLLDGITFTKPGEYTFQVLEVIPEDRVDGITYDRTLHTFTVTIRDVNGRLTASVVTHEEPLEADENGTFTVKPEFVNTYDTAPVYLDVFKTVVNESGSPLAGLQGFVFKLYNAKIEENGTWSIVDEKAVDSQISDGVGEARFAWTVDGTDVGTHHYILKETADSVPAGWTYDSREYHVTVVVAEDAATNNVTATTTVTDAEGNTVERIGFTNTYKPADAELTLNANKVLTGRTLTENDRFVFEIYKDGQRTDTVATGEITSIDETGKGIVAFSKMTFSEVGTYRYDVVEKNDGLGGITYDSTVYDLVVEVTDGGNGTLIANYYYEDATGTVVTFRNTYKTEPVTLTLGGSKTLTGRNLLAGEFTFELKDAEGKIIQSVKNAGLNAGGVFTFAPITYTEPGTYTYTISERAESLDRVTYDETVYTVTVEVADDHEGHLTVKVGGNQFALEEDNAYAQNGFDFTNKYTPREISVTLSGTKNLTGATLENGAYTFVLTDASGKELERVSNDASGKFTFSELTYNKTGTYQYKVYEQAGSRPGMTYDSTVYDVTVVISYNEATGVFEKSVSISGGGSLTFTNAYVGPVTIQIAGNKILNDAKGNAVDLKGGEFTFVLANVDKTELETVTNDANGKFTFSEITYWSAGNYMYYVTEQKGDDSSVIYDGTVYHVHVSVTMDDEGKLVATQTIGIPSQETEPESLTFTNKLREEARVHLKASKNLIGRVLEDEEFTFVLKDAAGEIVEEVKNSADGTISFSALRFDKEGEYKYTISETAGTDPYMVYDTETYEVVVTVKAPESDGEYANGPFEATVTYVGGSAPVFVNSPKKNVPMSFSFLKVDKNNQPLEKVGFTLMHIQCEGCTESITDKTVESDENGVVTFTDVRSGHQYILRETAKPDNYKLAPDRHVTDVYGKVYIDGEPADAEELIKIVNVAANQTELILKGIKYLRDAQGNLISATNGAYKFELYVKEGANYRPIDTQTNMATVEQSQAAEVYSEFIFRTIPLTQVGTYEYLIKEVPGTDPNVVYDATEYKVVVVVVQEDDNLEVESITANGEKRPVAFNNKLRAPVTGEITATKTVDGAALKENAFIFHLKDADGEILQTKRNDAKGNVVFDALTFDKAGTYVYKVIEQAGTNPYVDYDVAEYTVTFDVTPEGNGYKVTKTITLDGEVVDAIGFTNTVVDRGYAELTLEKVNEQDAPLAGAEFTLTHNCGEECGVEIAPIVGVSREDGKVILEKIPSGHSYTLSETVTPAHYTKGADHEVTVSFGKVTVDGEEVAEGGHVTIVNYFDGQTRIVGKKTLNGRKLTAGEFTFALYAADKEFTAEESPIQKVTNLADGSFSFDVIEYSTEGTYYYVVKELAGDDDNIEYDETVYNVTVKVEKDPTSGELKPVISVEKATEAVKTVNSSNKGDIILSDVLEFVNTFTPDSIEVVLSGTKNLTGTKTLEEGMFTFVLSDGESSWTTTNKADGSFEFEPIEFTKTGTFTYEVSESKGDNPNVTYDNTVYTVTIVVSQNAETGILTAETTIDNGGELEFNNAYASEKAELNLSGTKTLVGKELEAGEFSFQLIDEDGTVLQTVENTADGTFAFETLEYTTTGTHTYTVIEVKGDAKGVTYDEMVYTVAVVVTDSDGVLSAEATIDNDGELAFYNTYTEADPEEICVPIVIRKILLNCSDRFMTPAGFRFVLINQNGNTQHTTSSLIGTAGFVLNYSDADVGQTFTYTIQEIDTGIADMEYSQMVYTVEVTIERDEETNELVAQVMVNGFEMNRVILTFVNTYDPEIPDEPTEPSEPSDPTEPDEPTEPSEPSDPTEPDEPTEPSEPSEPSDPTEPEEPTEPSEPSDPTEPQKPGDDDTPDTGDRSHLFFWCMMASISLFALYVLKEMTRKGKYSA